MPWPAMPAHAMPCPARHVLCSSMLCRPVPMSCWPTAHQDDVLSHRHPCHSEQHRGPACSVSWERSLCLVCPLINSLLCTGCSPPQGQQACIMHMPCHAKQCTCQAVPVHQHSLTRHGLQLEHDVWPVLHEACTVGLARHAAQHTTCKHPGAHVMCSPILPCNCCMTWSPQPSHLQRQDLENGHKRVPEPQEVGHGGPQRHRLLAKHLQADEREHKDEEHLRVVGLDCWSSCHAHDRWHYAFS